jgi:chemotaxis protein methyltransferase CheR
MDAYSSLELSDSEFSSIKDLVFSTTGICLGESKRELVKRRFAPRVRELGLGSFGAYVRFVKSNDSGEMNKFCNAITTNLTSFFRENHHFEFLTSTVIPKIQARAAVSGRRLRVWSAGCSTGQEPYCLAITLDSVIRDLSKWDARILATDLDENCLAKARRGIYPLEDFSKTPKEIVAKYFNELPYDKSDVFAKPSVQAKAAIRNQIVFNKLNLMHKAWPMKGKFDVIMCRNVFIYFDKPTQRALVERFGKLQESGSYLFLGHSEVVQDPQEIGYRLVGKTTYERL